MKKSLKINYKPFIVISKTVHSAEPRNKSGIGDYQVPEKAEERSWNVLCLPLGFLEFNVELNVSCK